MDDVHEEGHSWQPFPSDKSNNLNRTSSEVHWGEHLLRLPRTESKTARSQRAGPLGRGRRGTAGGVNTVSKLGEQSAC